MGRERYIVVTPTRRKLIIRAYIFLTIFGLANALIGIALYKAYRASFRASDEKAFPYDVIRIGVDASFPPFAVDDGTTMYGLDIDLGNAIANEIDMPVHFTNMGFDGLYDSVIADQVDMVISALRVEPSRMKEVRYTQHYFDAGLVLVTPAGSPITMLEFMAGYRIAYEFGSIADAEVRDWERRIGHMQHMPYELPQYALDATRLEHADATLVDATSFRLYLREHPDWQTQHRYITHEVYTIMLRIDRIDAWELVNDALSSLKERGELDKIIAKWL